MEMFQKETALSRSSAFVQTLSLLLIMVLSLLFLYLFAMVFALPFWGKDVLSLLNGGEPDLSKPEMLSFLKYIQTVSQFALFVFPPLLFAFLVHRKIFDYLKLNNTFTLQQLVLSVLLIYVSLPFLSWLGSINQQIVLPEFFAGVEHWMKSAEESASQQILAFLNVESLGAILFNFVMIAFIPAIGEELLFRGVLIRLFKKWSGSIHIAVVISALLFSALHMQFYGFLPRFVLGLILGYTFAWTASLWIPIILHFLNNATILIVYYANRSTEISNPDVESFGASESYVVILISAIISFLLIYVIHKQKKTFEI